MMRSSYRFSRFFSRVLLGTGVAIRLVLLAQMYGLQFKGIDVLLLSWGLIPYAILYAIAERISSKAILVISGIGSDLLATVAAIAPGSSTDPAGLFFQPLYAVVFLIPLTALADYVAGRRGSARTQKARAP
jgi:hypothetical protein